MEKSYKLDCVRLINYCNELFTDSHFEKVTGISQEKKHLYLTGRQKLKKEQCLKIVNYLHVLGKELLAIKMVLSKTSFKSSTAYFSQNILFCKTNILK